MFDRVIRPVKDAALAPLARAIGASVSPMAITGVAFAAGLGSAGAAYAGEWNLALVLWALCRILDGLDGVHARMHRRESSFGGYVDILLDFIVYASIPIAIAAHARTEAITFAALLLVASFYVNAASWMYLSALLEQRQQGAAARGEVTAVTMPPGVIGGTETIAFYVAFFLWPASQRPLFLVMAALVLLTAILRVFWAKRHL